jgi:hypothetical protein
VEMLKAAVVIWAMTTSSNTTTAVVPAKPKAGRPRAYVDLKRVEELAAQGMSVNFICSMVGISERAMWARMESDPAIREAYDRGIAQAVNEASGLIIQKIRAGDAQCAMFFLRNRAKWNVGASAELNINVRHDAPVMTIDMSNINSIAAECSRLLDADDPDAVDAEFTEVPFDLASAMR